MEKTHLNAALLILFLLILQEIQGQSLLEKAGGIRTSFEIIAKIKNVLINVNNQIT